MFAFALTLVRKTYVLRPLTSLSCASFVRFHCQFRHFRFGSLCRNFLEKLESQKTRRTAGSLVLRRSAGARWAPSGQALDGCPFAEVRGCSCTLSLCFVGVRWSNPHRALCILVRPVFLALAKRL